MYPQYVEIENKRYKINTDFRVALECNRIAEDNTIGDLERALAIIYTLFGEDGINTPDHYEKLLELGQKYLLCGESTEEFNRQRKDNTNDLDFNKCEGLIKSSFKYDYKYDPYSKDYLHWYEFNNDLMNLSASEMGTCCVLNRVVDILNRKTKDIKDKKQKDNLVKTQNELRKKYCIEHRRKATDEQRKSAENFLKSLGIIERS